MVDFGSCGSVIGRLSSGAMQMVRERALDCLTVYRIELYRHIFLLLLRECTLYGGRRACEKILYSDRSGDPLKD